MSIFASVFRDFRHVVVAATGAVGLLAGCGEEPPGRGALETEEIIETQSALRGGVGTTARPEVGMVITSGGSCSGTLIARNWVLTASHCTGHLNLVFPPGSTDGPTFRVDPRDAPSQAFSIERAYSLGYPIGTNDVMLLRLTAPVPATLVPTVAGLSSVPPTDGSWVTIYGYGCNPGTTLGGSRQFTSRRVRIGEIGQFMTENTLCPGDSGGPAFSDGRIFGVNSQSVGGVDIYADVVRQRDAILAIMASAESPGRIGSGGSLDRSLGPDVTLSAWCSGDRQALYYGDVDGDRDLDALCHDAGTGVVTYARGENREIRPQGRWAGPFCSHAGGQFHVGDFTGDGRTDLLCIDTRDGHKWVVPSSGDWRAPYSTVAFNSVDPWCSHAGAQLHVGDFDGDRRTDLLCRDPRTGWLWIDFASADVGTLFGFRRSVHTSSWCSHDSSALYVSDFNGDGRSDLLCHTKATGALDVKTAAPGGSFAHADYWSDHDIGFCTAAGGRIRTYDFTGEGRADLLCSYAGGGGRSIISIGDTTPFSTDLSWTIGGWRPGVDKPWLTGNLASQPWARPR